MFATSVIVPPGGAWEERGGPSHYWTSRELAAEAVKQGLVASLSAGHLRKVLKKKRYSPTAVATG